MFFFLVHPVLVRVWICQMFSLCCLVLPCAALCCLVLRVLWLVWVVGGGWWKIYKMVLLYKFRGTFKFFFNLKSFFTNKQYEVILTPPLKSSILSLIVRLKDIYRGSELETGTHAAHHPLSIPVVTVW